MTQAEKKRIARRARQHGYYDRGNSLAVTCPECHENVSTPFSRYAGTIIQQLDAAMLDHLDHACATHNPDDAREIGG